MQKDYDIGMKWNDRLKKARDDANKSDTDIAKACSLSNPTVHAWMTGKTINIEAKNLLAACKLLKVSPFWVMNGEGRPALSDVYHAPQDGQVDAAEIAHLIVQYGQLDVNSRQRIMDIARLAPKPTRALPAADNELK